MISAVWIRFRAFRLLTDPLGSARCSRSVRAQKSFASSYQGLIGQHTRGHLPPYGCVTASRA